MPKMIRRRDLLVIGTSALGLGGCVYLRYGASHEVFESKGASVDEGWLRIPLDELKRVADGDVLQVEVASYPELLITQDREGQYLVVTAERGHWGCTVYWAPKEQEWTCPCHGSRFSPNGEIMEGPADEPLRSVPFEIVDETMRVNVAGLAEA